MPAQDSTHLLVGITGHRHLHPTAIAALQAQVRVFFADLAARYPQLPVMLLSSLAEGSDQLVAQIALDLGLRVVAPLPLPIALYREDFESADNLALFDRQLQQVEQIAMPLRRGVALAEVSVPGVARNRQYAQAGIFISSHCHVLLALWDGRDSEHLGGTAQTVRFHLHGDLPGEIERRRGTTHAMLGLDEETVVYHLPTRRSSDPEPVAVAGRWLTADDEVVAQAVMPATFDRMFRQQEAFNSDRAKYAEAIAAERRTDTAAPDCPIHAIFVAADWLAHTYQLRVQRVLKVVYLLAAAMGFAFFLYTDVATHQVIINLFLVFFLAGLGVVSVSRRREWQRKYLDYRALAEGLRVQSFWRRAGVADLHSATFAHDNFMHKQDVELEWIRNVMRNGSVEGLLQPPQAPDVDAVVREWIGSTGSDGQLHYFTVASARRARLHRRAELAGLGCLWVCVAISAVLAIFSRGFDPQLQRLLVAIMGIVSVAAAVHEAYAYKKADKELIKQYRYMLRIFNAARRRLNKGGGIREQQQVLRTLGEAALAEHAEWTLMHRERPLEHSRL